MNGIAKVRRGFTLVEILIVVIILGILAAIVIPQFTNASQDARKSSLVSQLQTLRSQVNLYAMQHLDQYPPKLVTGGTTAFDDMTVKTNADHTTTGTPILGPYLQAAPRNSLNGFTKVAVQTTDAVPGAANTDLTAGWVFNTTNGKVWATSTKGGFIYNEGNPTDTNNDK